MNIVLEKFIKIEKRQNIIEKIKSVDVRNRLIKIIYDKQFKSIIYNNIKVDETLSIRKTCIVLEACCKNNHMYLIDLVPVDNKIMITVRKK
jgi:hypothetical protein